MIFKKDQAETSLFSKKFPIFFKLNYCFYYIPQKWNDYNCTCTFTIIKFSVDGHWWYKIENNFIFPHKNYSKNKKLMRKKIIITECLARRDTSRIYRLLIDETVKTDRRCTGERIRERENARENKRDSILCNWARESSLKKFSPSKIIIFQLQNFLFFTWKENYCFFTGKENYCFFRFAQFLNKIEIITKFLFAESKIKNYSKFILFKTV